MFPLVAMNIYQELSLRRVTWNQLKSENTDILYRLKEQVQIVCKKACSVKEQAWIQHFDIFVKIIFNPFHGTGVFLFFPKYIRKLEVAWCFQGALTGTSAIKWVRII